MIREILRTRDNQEIALGQKCKFATVPMHRHTRWQRVGVQSDNPSSEKLNTSAQDSYPSFISWLFPATAVAIRGGGGLERKEGSVVVPTELVPLSLEVCGGDGGGVKPPPSSLQPQLLATRGHNTGAKRTGPAPPSYSSFPPPSVEANSPETARNRTDFDRNFTAVVLRPPAIKVWIFDNFPCSR
ncbi:hypothetical protein L3X38_004611 [Prunus dulcis]|uniref:Uncharacterized protein n=1 Tax=Prunus dulcis TaxID=3755 RepID=A0AAD4ZPB3_PRUDU|nr:hypothetical protein L3X38_004611 [Prunus dulcis]